ncbi:MAG TPA: hypothetical protein VFC19_36015 [Candidatus Limnocylindrales bacterium]|nr:hypothetical protein [Candidatus Limnocylindrales bacterium]
MATDGDRHQLGDPMSRIADDGVMTTPQSLACSTTVPTQHG